MSYWFARIGNTLVPADERAERYLKRFEEGECAQFEVERSRSYKWHKFYVQCCKEIGENNDPERDWKSVDRELRIRAGHFDRQALEGAEFVGVAILVPRRIAFRQLTADEWRELWPKLSQAMLETFGYDCEARGFAEATKEDESTE